jgi:hypothetical protein
MMALAALCLIWAGMVLGISFLETPVKFTAPSVTRAIGLDVGRHVFGVFSKVEIAFTLLAIGFGFLAVGAGGVRPGSAGIFPWVPPLAVVALVVLLQSAWLLPVLDARVVLLLDGQTPPRSAHHVIYIVLEVLKLGCLLAAGVSCLTALKAAAG